MEALIESLYWFPKPYTWKTGVLTEDGVFEPHDIPYHIRDGILDIDSYEDLSGCVAIYDDTGEIKSFLL